MSYEIKLEIFEGPLDLLLHLIHRCEVSITDIPIALITQQYLETVELMKSLNLDVAGEYLVMAAYLTHIKSQMLLPVDESNEGDADPAADPRDELVAHLLEYKRYKEAAENLASIPQLDHEVFARQASDDVLDLPRSQQPIEVHLADLLGALRELLERTPRRDLIELEPERLLVKDKINQIMERLEAREWITFGSLFDEDDSRLNILTTFLALLEVVKLQLVRLYQERSFGTILISKRVIQEDKATGEEEETPAT
jgi:segregation and condensation protein A